MLDLAHPSFVHKSTIARILNRLLSEQEAGHAAMVRPSDYRYAPMTDPT